MEKFISQNLRIILIALVVFLVSISVGAMIYHSEVGSQHASILDLALPVMTDTYTDF